MAEPFTPAQVEQIRQIVQDEIERWRAQFAFPPHIICRDAAGELAIIPVSPEYLTASLSHPEHLPEGYQRLGRDRRADTQ